MLKHTVARPGLEGRALADNSSKKLIAYHEAGLPRWSGTCGRLSW